jgi:hypothetical protein
MLALMSSRQHIGSNANQTVGSPVQQSTANVKSPVEQSTANVKSPVQQSTAVKSPVHPQWRWCSVANKSEETLIKLSGRQ